MLKNLVRQLLQALTTLLVVSVVVFAAGRMVGDPLDLYLPLDAGPDQRAFFEHKLGFDRPLVTQYLSFLGNAVQGDLGNSVQSGKSVTSLIAGSLPRSLQLAGVALGMALLIGIPLGVVAAVRRNSVWDYLARFVAVIGQSVPSFVIALFLMLMIAVRGGWLPTSGIGTWKHVVLPAVSMAIIVAASVMRLMRTSMLEVLRSDYIRMHRTKGLPERLVVWKHATRNAIIVVINFAAVYLVILVTNAVVIETVFAWPGFGRLAYEAVRNRDYPVIQGAVLTGALLYVTSSFVAEFLSAAANPRQRRVQAAT